MSGLEVLSVLAVMKFPLHRISVISNSLDFEGEKIRKMGVTAYIKPDSFHEYRNLISGIVNQYKNLATGDAEQLSK